jgi:carbamoyltransferase
MSYFEFATGFRMCNSKKWEILFGISARDTESELTQPYMNLALAIQLVTEEIVLKLVKTAQEITNCKNLTLAGGVALNCVANGKIIESKIFDNLWIQPAAGDAGGALGAAYAAHFIGYGGQRSIDHSKHDSIKGSYLGPEYSRNDVARLLRKNKAVSILIENFDQLIAEVAKLIADGNVIGWFQGRMEWGPRALGNRSILGDPRNPEMQKKLNLKIKFREGFRPFAPSVLAEDIYEYFCFKGKSPYMQIVAPVQNTLRKKIPINYDNLELYERLYYVRSDIPAVTHVDFSARIQSVHKETNPKYWELINAFKKITGYGLLVNTSFNVRGEPIVCTPEDAYRCFMRTEMDYLVIGDYLFSKSDQPEFKGKDDWKTEFVLD